MVKKTIILVIGNPIDGLQFVGPFAGAENATSYAESISIGGDWWITELQSQKDFEARAKEG